MIGRTLGHYRVLEQIGSGGMGVVYRARDERLERDVALKMLPAGTLGDEAARRRFRREALALSQLNHPNIATVHDFDTQDGIDFLILEHIEGETLDARLARGPLTEREVEKLGAQLAAGLEAAHQHGVVHRDLKPGNLRVTPDGRLKILDFGLARLLQPAVDHTTLKSLTDPQALAGTLPYMAPEQLAQGKSDARSDLFAAGAVLYEMATGRRPFPQTGAPLLMYAIMNEPVEPPSAAGRRISAGLENVILKALEKDLDLRYQSARELRVDLERLLAPSAPPGRPRPRFIAARLPVGTAAAAGLIAALFVLWILNPGGCRDRIVGQAPGPMNSLAVLPLVNLSGDPGQDYFADGMTEEMITCLGKISALTVIARSSVMEYKGTRKPLRQIARALGVGNVLEGSVLRAGDRVRVSVQLIAAAAGKLVWSESYERRLSDVLALQSEVALAIARQIQVKLTPREQARLAESGPVDPQAHEAYLLGRHHWNKLTHEGLTMAIHDFRRAIAINPRYAMAYAGLADSYYALSNWYFRPDSAMPLVRDAVARALELDGGLADAHTLQAVVHAFYEWDFAAAEPEYRRGIELNPSSGTAHLWYGYYLLQMGRMDEAREEIARAQELDPLNSFTRWIAAWPTFYQRHYDQAIGELRRLAELDPQAWFAYSLLGEAYEQKGYYPQAIEHLRKARTLGGNVWVHAALARTFAEAGRRDSALHLLRDLETLSARQYVTPYGLATVQAALGDQERALELLEQASRERSEDLILMNVDPRLDRLRSDPRFVTLLRRIGFVGS